MHWPNIFLSLAEEQAHPARGIELTCEVRVDKSEAFLNKLLTLDGVNEASLVAYQSETV